MKVLYITKNSDRPESATIEGLRAHGVEPFLMADLRSPYVQRLKGSGVPVWDAPLEKSLDRAVLARIRRLVIDEDIDLVHAFTNRTVLHMVLATRGLPVKLIAYRGVIGNVSWWSPLSWFRFLNPRITRIVCVAEAIRRYLLSQRLLWLRLDPARVLTINKGHDLAWYTSEPVDLGEFGIPPGAVTVTCSSRLRRTKGLWDLVRAIGRIDPAKNIHLLLLGHRGNDSLRAEAAKCPRPERVHFAGFRRDAPAVMAASDICAMPSLKEGLSRTVIEAMAYRVPPIVSDAGGNPELVIDGECGLVVPYGDVGALAEAIDTLHDDPALRARLGEAARERIRTRFRIEDTIARTHEMYREVLAE